MGAMILKLSAGLAGHFRRHSPHGAGGPVPSTGVSSVAAGLACALVTVGLQVAVTPSAGALTVTTTQLGLDACNAPTPSQMQAFWNGTPYWWFNIYLGGSMRACANSNLNAAWISQIRGMGWKLLPTWVGPQAPCSGYSSRFSYDLGTAYNQGYNEAAAAYSAILNLQMSSDTPIAYDLEAFNTGNASCVNAAKSFVDGWTHYLAVPPRQVSGVYGSVCASSLNSYASIPRPPDFIWGAYYNGNPDTGDMACVNSGYWIYSQRHKQYRGGHNETYNGVTLNVDNDSSNGPVYST